MRYFLVSLLIIFPGLAAGQEIHTFSNGDVADADMINQNFDLLKDMSGGTAISVEANCAEDSLQFSRLWIEKSSYKNVVFHISGECEITEEVSRLFSALEGSLRHLSLGWNQYIFKSLVD